MPFEAAGIAKVKSAHGLFSQTVPKSLGSVSITLWNPLRSGPSPSLHMILACESKNDLLRKWTVDFGTEALPEIPSPVETSYLVVV